MGKREGYEVIPPISGLYPTRSGLKRIYAIGPLLNNIKRKV